MTPAAWALQQSKTDDRAAILVLVCLAIHANKFGCGSFPAVSTLCRQTRICERWVREKIALLLRLGLIVHGNQDIAAAYCGRSDRRPVVYDLVMEVGTPVSAEPVDNAVDKNDTGCIPRHHGVHSTTSRGALGCTQSKNKKSVGDLARERVKGAPRSATETLQDLELDQRRRGLRR